MRLKGPIWLAMLAAIAGGCTRAKSEKPSNLESRKTMRIKLAKFSFEAPAGLDDWTNYSFKSKDRMQVLTISAGKRPDGVTSLESLMASRRAGLASLPADAVSPGPESSGKLGSMPARVFSFKLKDHDDVFDNHWAVAFLEPDRYVHLSYGCRVPGGGGADFAKADFAKIVSSAGDDERGAAPTGFTRHWAGSFYLDVPGNLNPPRTYVFVTHDEKTWFVMTSFDPIRDPSHLAPPLRQEAVEEDGPRGTISEIADGPFEEGIKSGSSISYVLTSTDGLVREACRRVEVLAGAAAPVHLYVRGPLESAASLNRAMSLWIRTFESSR